jgi:transposase
VIGKGYCQSFVTAAVCATRFCRRSRAVELKGVTRQLLWEEYSAAHPACHYRYTQFCFFYRQWRKKLKVSLRQSYTVGEKMLVDYCGKTVEIVNAATIEVREAQVFVVVLGASNYTFAEATETQKLAD